MLKKDNLQIYQDTIKKNYMSKNTVFNYKEEFKTVKNYSDFLKKNLENIKELREKRKAFQAIKENKTIDFLLLEKKKNILETQINENYKFLNNGFKINIQEKFNYFVDSVIDYNYYSKSCTWNKYHNQGILNLVLADLKTVKINELIFDNILNVKIITRKTKENNIILRKTQSLKLVKKQFVLIEYYIASQENIHFHSVESYEKAIDGLKRKIKKDIKEKQLKKLTLETILTVSDYKKLTGACQIGINEFLTNHNFKSNIKIKIKDLLPFLEKNNEYGLNKIKKLLNENNLV